MGSPFATNRGMLWSCILLAIVVRLGAIAVFADSLENDRDGYLGLAERLAAGDGYTQVDRVTPTAFRPPLLPLVLAVFRQIANPAVAVALCNLVATVGLLAGVVHVQARSVHGLTGWRCWVAPTLVALDPMLVLYTTQPMTEVLAACLAVLVVDRALAVQTNRSTRSCLALGVLSGMLVLCRPVFWPFVILVVGWSSRAGRSSSGAVSWSFRSLAVVLGGLLAVSAPWVVRNQLQLSSPVLTTTHGGYTLLLGNNPEFDEQVVRQPWGAVWSAERLESWQQELRVRQVQSGIGADERSVDRWMTQQAWDWMRTHPDRAVAGSWLKLRRFWAVTPLGPQWQRLPELIILGLAGYGVGLYLLAIVGLASRRVDRRLVVMCILLAGSLTVIHSLYWSNARFRAPLIPFLAIAAATTAASRGSARESVGSES